jgi:anti-sigma28 factor (negative regulator of flagellin synthesis)
MPAEPSPGPGEDAAEGTTRPPGHHATDAVQSRRRGVEELRRSVADGDYHVDALAVADAFLAFYRVDAGEAG